MLSIKHLSLLAPTLNWIKFDNFDYPGKKLDEIACIKPIKSGYYTYLTDGSIVVVGQFANHTHTFVYRTHNRYCGYAGQTWGTNAVEELYNLIDTSMHDKVLNTLLPLRYVDWVQTFESALYGTHTIMDLNCSGVCVAYDTLKQHLPVHTKGYCIFVDEDTLYLSLMDDNNVHMLVYVDLRTSSFLVTSDKTFCKSIFERCVQEAIPSYLHKKETYTQAELIDLITRYHEYFSKADITDVRQYLSNMFKGNEPVTLLSFINTLTSGERKE